MLAIYLNQSFEAVRDSFTPLILDKCGLYPNIVNRELFQDPVAQQISGTAWMESLPGGSFAPLPGSGYEV
jgi:hypothetical protein